MSNLNSLVFSLTKVCEIFSELNQLEKMTDSFTVYPCGVHHDPDALQWDSASHISILIFQSNNIEKFLYLKIPLHAHALLLW